MNRSEREFTAAIRRCELFRSLPATALTQLTAAVIAIEVPRGGCLYQSGKRSPGVYVVASGRIIQSVGPSADATKVVGLNGPGGHLGLSAAVLGVPETVTAGALVDSKLLLIPCGALLACAGGSAALGMNIAAALARQVQTLTADIETFALHSGRRRVADYLIRIAAGNGAAKRPVALPAKKSIIASRLGLTPEYFSRMLHELIAGGAIAVNGRQITVLDALRLRESAR